MAWVGAVSSLSEKDPANNLYLQPGKNRGVACNTFNLPFQSVPPWGKGEGLRRYDHHWDLAHADTTTMRQTERKKIPEVLYADVEMGLYHVFFHPLTLDPQLTKNCKKKWVRLSNFLGSQ